MGSRKIAIGLALVAFLALVTACHNDKSDNPVRPTGPRPVITSMSSDASEVRVGGYTSVYCDAYDPDGDSLTYSWSADYGAFPEGYQKAAVRWVAPSSPCVAIITCAVTNNHFTTSMDIGVVVKPRQ